MRTPPRIHFVTAVVTALLAMTGCDSAAVPDRPDAAPATSSATPVAEPAPAPAAAPEETAVDAPASLAAGPDERTPAETIAASAAATAAVTAAHLKYATNGFESLTATSWAADVTVSPPAAKGSGALLVDGERTPTDFDISEGRLHIENADGTISDVGTSRGVLDPIRLLDPHTGLAALVASVSAVEPAPELSTLEESPMIGLRAKLPALAVSGVLLPAGAIPTDEAVAVTLWLNPADGDVLRQMIIVGSTGSVTVQLFPVSTTR